MTEISTNDKDLSVSALRWLYEMEIISDPTVLKNLKENILLCSPSIKDCEFIVLEDRKEILVFLKLSLLGRWFNKKFIFTETMTRLNELLPNFRKRVTSNKEIFELALKKVKEVYADQNNNFNRDLNKLNGKSSDSSS